MSVLFVHKSEYTGKPTATPMVALELWVLCYDTFKIMPPLNIMKINHWKWMTMKVGLKKRVMRTKLIIFLFYHVFKTNQLEQVI